MKGILGRKLGMTQVFTTDGVLIPVTVVEALPNVVLQKKTLENDGYEAVQLGFEDLSEKGSNKAEKGHAAKASTAAKRFVREIRGTEMTNLKSATKSRLIWFAAGEIVDVTGTSKAAATTAQSSETTRRWARRRMADLRTCGISVLWQRPDVTTAGSKRERLALARKVDIPQRHRIWKSSRLMLKTTIC